MTKYFFAKRALIGKELHLQKNIYLTVSEGKLQEISSQRPNGKVVEFNNSLIVPGFVNGHIHIADSFAKEQGYGMEIEKIVAPPDGLKHRLLREMQMETKLKGIDWAVREMIAGGITGFMDFREEGEEGVRLLEEALSENDIERQIFGRPLSKHKIKDLLSISDGIGLSSLNNYSDHRLKAIKRIVQREGKLVAYHASETLNLRQESIELHGKNDIIRGIRKLSPNFIVHGTHASKTDVKHLKKEEIPVIVCPRANAYLGVGIPPIKRFVNADIKLCIGTDNVMLNAPNFFREFDYLVRIARLQGITIRPKKILKMVTINPGKFLKGPHYLGEGTPADFFVFDLEKPNVKGINSPCTALILRGSKKNVKSTYIHGKLIWKDDETENIDEMNSK